MVVLQDFPPPRNADSTRLSVVGASMSDFVTDGGVRLFLIMNLKKHSLEPEQFPL